MIYTALAWFLAFCGACFLVMGFALGLLEYLFIAGMCGVGAVAFAIGGRSER